MTSAGQANAALAERLNDAAPTVRRIAALDLLLLHSIGDDVFRRLVMVACAESDARTRVLLARAVERHSPGRPMAGDLLSALDAALDACDEPLGRHALLLARDAAASSRVRE